MSQPPNDYNKNSNQPPDPNKNQQGGGMGPKNSNMMTTIVIIFLVIFGINMLTSLMMPRRQTQIPYNQFLELVRSGNVKEVEIGESEIAVALKTNIDQAAVEKILYPDGKDEWQMVPQGGATLTVGIVPDLNLTQFLDENGVKFFKPIVYNSPILSFISTWVIPFLLIYLVYSLIMRTMMKKMGGGAGGGMFSVGKSKAKEYNVEKNTGVTFADVAGQDEAKESLEELVDFLHDPKRYEAIGAKQPKGALLVGPPGTGKTLLAKAVAGEAKVVFYSISGSEFVEMFVGVGASRVRDLFDNAKKNAPCIIFIDEIDAIGKSRDNQLGSNDEREQTLNQLLAEMDGFDSSVGIIVLAATNRPEILDKALLRPGRFDRRIIVEKPDLPGREAILKVHAKKVKMGPDVNLNGIAKATPGATGADLANMINEAALRAVRMGRKAVLQEDLMEAVETVIAGQEKKDRIMNEKEKRMVAYHEVGHALVTALQKNSQPVTKITIVPRTMGSLGYSMSVPDEERYLLTKEELMAEITSMLGGRAAEIIKFSTVTTGASNDIERATKMARSMVTQYGMSDKFGPISLESTQNQYLDGRNVSTASESTNAIVDDEVKKILNQSQEDAIELLKNNLLALEKITQRLLDKENITGEEFMVLLKEAKEEKSVKQEQTEPQIEPEQTNSTENTTEEA